MTIAEMTKAAIQYADLWRLLMPSVEPPPGEQFLMWAGVYSENQVSRGISGAARKLRAMRNFSRPMTPEDVMAYASSIMRHEAMGQRRFQ